MINLLSIISFLTLLGFLIFDKDADAALQLLIAIVLSGMLFVVLTVFALKYLFTILPAHAVYISFGSMILLIGIISLLLYKSFSK